MRYVIFALLAFPLGLLAMPDEDWSKIEAMDAGPKRKPATQQEVQLIARQHLDAQRALIESFLSRYPNDPRAFDARLRQAAILATTGNMDGVQKPVDEAMRILVALEKTPGVALSKRADAGFQRVSLVFQSNRGREREMRDAIVDAARGFVAKYPGDRRGPRLLVEASTICDVASQRALLEEARNLTSEDALKKRISDDLTRLDLLDKPLQFSAETIQGGRLDTATLKGNVVALVFWSAESPHCLIWLPGFARAMRQIPQSQVRIVLVALDASQQAVASRLSQLGIPEWTTVCDGKGWESPLARRFGINSLPTVIVLDRSGVVRSISARGDYDLVIRRLLRE